MCYDTPVNDQAPPVSTWRRLRAYLWFLWGQSWCHWGLRTAEPDYFRSGVRAFDRALRDWPEFAAGYYRRGLIRGRELGEPQAGIADLTRAIELDPEWAEPYMQRGFFRRFHGDPNGAADDLRSFLALAGRSPWRAEAASQLAAVEAELASERHSRGPGEEGRPRREGAT